MSQPNPATTYGTEPAILVIFGITGDLSRRKLLPALYHLVKDKLLHEKTVIVGVTRRQIDSSALIDDIALCSLEEDGVCDPSSSQRLRGMIRIHQMDLHAADDYVALKQRLDAIEAEQGVSMQRLFYLSVPPQAIEPIVHHLGRSHLDDAHTQQAARPRLLIEKPFGYDYRSAKRLIGAMSRYFDEEQMFRIDHYVAKETVQNILTFRFNNPIFADIWSAAHISEIEIIAAETIGIEGRATFYENTGALRDLIQSHLLQLLAFVTMHRPKELTSDGVHMAKLRALKKLHVPDAGEVASVAVRGQYEAYSAEVKNSASKTETYAAVQLASDDKRWRGVPMILRAGKALAQKKTEIIVRFHPAAMSTHQNQLIFRIQPNEGISLCLNAKRPGLDYQDELVEMDFSYAKTFDDHGHPDAYERVLIDAIRGDRTLFATSDEVLAAWRVVDPILHVWNKSGDDLLTYKPGAQNIPDPWA